MGVIAVCGSRHQDSHLASIMSLLRLLVADGHRLVFEGRFGRYLEQHGFGFDSGIGMSDEFPADARMVVSLGGDGTFLRAARWAGATETPVLGVNTGHLGFLASLSPDDTDSVRRAVAGEGIVVERRQLLELSGDALPDDFWRYGLNELAIIKAETASMITVNAEIDGIYLADYLADGLVVSTPTGSTAYNLSVGGPLIQPTINCMVISPIAPHSLTMRPLVIDGNVKLRLTPSSRAESCRVSLDGRSFLMECGHTIEVSAAPFCVRMVRLKEDTFPDILRTKLLWGRR